MFLFFVIIHKHINKTLWYKPVLKTVAKFECLLKDSILLTQLSKKKYLLYDRLKQPTFYLTYYT